MIGSVDLTTPLVVTDDVKAYQLTWIIKDMGIEATHGGGAVPAEWKGGPFVPNFTLKGGATTDPVETGNNLNVNTN